MQLSPRPTRIPLTCPCGARLSVIPRLQGTEVKCPRCQEALLVPGVPIKTSAVVVASRLAESIPANVVSKQVLDSGTRDIFGTLLSEPTARLNAALHETFPKSLKTLREESGYQDVYNYIQQLLKEGKVRPVGLPGSRTGYIINPDWLKRVQNTSQTVKTTCDAVPPATGKPRQEVEINLPPSVVSSTPERDTPDGLTQPTRKQIQKQLPRSLFGEQPRSGSYATPDNAVVLPASIGRSELTTSQKSVFDAVESSYALKGISPSIPELQTATSLNRFDTLKEVDALVRKGLFEFDRSAARGIRIIPEADRVPDHESSASAVLHPIERERTAPRPIVSGQDSTVVENADASGATAGVLAHKGASSASIIAATPQWVDWLFNSEVLNQRYLSAGRRVPPKEQVRDFLSLLVREGSFASRETVCSSLALLPIRYEGFIAVVMRIVNIDNVPILTKTEAGDGVRLNVSLLHHQFGIPK